MRAHLLAVVLLASISTAASASPEDERDFDQEREEFSEFWERALAPNSKLYAQLIAQARALGFERSASSYKRAKRLLSDAIKLAPADSEAYWELGLLHQRRSNWTACADTLGEVFARDSSYRPKGGTEWAFDQTLGVCLAQAGSYRKATKHFKRILARGTDLSEIHRNIGECYMALGELNRAIEYLETARRLQSRRQSEAHYALAVAFDRNEQRAKVRAHLEKATRHDRNLTRLASRTNFIPQADRYFYLGLAHAQRNSAWALVYFRHHIHSMPSGPWTERSRHHAAEQVAKLSAELPIEVRGSAQWSKASVRKALRAHWSSLQTCVARSPGLLLRVKLKQQVLQRSQRAAPGVTVLVDYAFGQKTRDIEQAVQCVDRKLLELVLPPLKGHPGSYGIAEFPVILAP